MCLKKIFDWSSAAFSYHQLKLLITWLLTSLQAGTCFCIFSYKSEKIIIKPIVLVLDWNDTCMFYTFLYIGAKIVHFLIVHVNLKKRKLVVATIITSLFHEILHTFMFLSCRLYISLPFISSYLQINVSNWITKTQVERTWYFHLI